MEIKIQFPFFMLLSQLRLNCFVKNATLKNFFKKFTFVESEQKHVRIFSAVHELAKC
jgi:hypothetical protein